MITDPEESNTRLVSFTLRPANPIRTVADLREDVIADLFYIMLNDRLDEIARRPDAPFLSAGSGTSGLVRPVTAAVISVQLQEEKTLEAMESLITEIERVRRHGFTETEKARAEQELLKFYEQLYNERENTASRSFAEDLRDNFLEGEAIPSIENVYETVQALIPDIALEEVNQAASLLAANDNRVVYVTGPEKEETPLPTEDELAAVVASVESLVIEPYVDGVAGSELMAEVPAPAAIVEESELPGIGVTALTLENGVRVLLKQTDFKDDEIVFNAVSPGGSSLVPDEDFPEASTIDDVVNESGLGEFSQTELVKLLAGKTVSAAPYIRELAEGMEGKTTPADLETLFQLIHLYFTAPRADQDAFEVFQTKQRTTLINREQDPNAALSDALNEALYGDTIRRGVAARGGDRRAGPGARVRDLPGSLRGRRRLHLHLCRQLRRGSDQVVCADLPGHAAHTRPRRELARCRAGPAAGDRGCARVQGRGRTQRRAACLHRPGGTRCCDRDETECGGGRARYHAA